MARSPECRARPNQAPLRQNSMIQTIPWGRSEREWRPRRYCSQWLTRLPLPPRHRENFVGRNPTSYSPPVRDPMPAHRVQTTRARVRWSNHRRPSRQLQLRWGRDPMPAHRVQTTRARVRWSNHRRPSRQLQVLQED